MSNGQQGTACPDDNWIYQGHVNNPLSGYAYRNCTDYVAWKIKQADGVTLPNDMGDASSWGTYLENHGNQPMAPKAGAIAWEAGGDHVAYVESVVGNNVTISEYNEQYRSGYFSWGDGIYDERTVLSSDFKYFVVGTPKASSSPSTTQPRKTSSPPRPKSGPFIPKFTWVWSSVADGGYKLTGQLTIGSPQHVTSAAHLRGFGDSANAVTSKLRSQCGGFNPQTDAVIPAALTMRNTTSGFSSDLNTVIFADDTNSVPIKVAAAYTSGVICHVLATADNAYFDGGESWSEQFTKVAPGASGGTAYAYLVLPHYFSPNSPHGNTGILNQTALALASSFYLKDHQQIVNFAGPGYDQGDNKRLGLMPLSGQMIACEGVRC
jgi:surface antigen